MKYVFPAILTPEEGGYVVRFPDVKNCFTEGDDLAEALDMAQDVLNLMLMDMEDDGVAISAPSDIQTIPHEENEIVTLITADTMEYRKLYGNKAVKKTLSIPAWLNTAAEQKGLNFSAVLQSALKKALDIV